MAQTPNNQTSPLRHMFNLVERAVAERVEPLVQSAGFATAMSRYVSINRRVGRTLSSVSSGVLHLINIPTTSDVARLHEHLNAVDSQLSLLTRELEGKPDSGPEKPAGRAKSTRTSKEHVETSTTEED
jgi:hypothetical protein